MSSDKMIEARELRAGQTIVWNGAPHLVLDHSFNKTAMRGGIVKCKLKNLYTKSIFVEELSNWRLEKAQLNKQEVVFTYREGEFLKFCDTQTYEEYSLPLSEYSWASPYLVEGMTLQLVWFEDHLINFVLPEKVKLSIVSLSPVNDEVQKASFNTGHECLVPMFLKQGDEVYISTQDGKYSSK
ncbi:translation elongation factor P [Candidatus Mycoplasma haematominutum]|uniref:Translation elongation factor P n=1 Tax=Candidatus Mycoplasma haematominutum 'Birmingham 1' TaxID=1116213 RepID=G8C3M5_9MOLU|nr:translation elongation factor P [Candidatus Mycoplasma haematominutum]CCE66923.1 translation elongation factor P [Candidatus Mycoplasma haematominutum 'Birmingham 1']